jgi:hypothetical protein
MSPRRYSIFSWSKRRCTQPSTPDLQIDGTMPNTWNLPIVPTKLQCFGLDMVRTSPVFPDTHFSGRGFCRIYLRRCLVNFCVGIMSSDSAKRRESRDNRTEHDNLVSLEENNERKKGSEICAYYSTNWLHEQQKDLGRRKVCSYPPTWARNSIRERKAEARREATTTTAIKQTTLECTRTHVHRLYLSNRRAQN